MLPDSHRAEYILHTRKPRFLAHIEHLEFSDLPHKGKNKEIIINYLNPDGLLELIRLHVIDNIDLEIDLSKILDRMADWYIAYLKWQDKKIGEQHGHLLRDYNSKVPGLKIVYGPPGWLVVYMGNVEVFRTEPEMDNYLEKYLNIDPGKLDEGYVNQIRDIVT
jgi:hypothetical protein